MRIRLLYFAAVRERLGRDEEPFELPARVTVSGLLDRLTGRYPVLAPLRPALQVAINEQVVAPDAELAEGDVVALLPPVSGGSDGLCRIGPEPLSVDEALAAVSHAQAGAVVLFCGTVRERTGERKTLELTYEAYVAMALRTFRHIAAEVGTKHTARLAISHRTGTLPPGAIAVVVAASAAHRPEAFAACREAIDRVKKEAPIWKKELTEAGSDWVESCG